MSLKPLVILTNRQIAAGNAHRWSVFPAPQNVISDITTPAVNLNNDLTRVVSAIPSPLARYKMFKYALIYTPDAGVPQGITAFYQQLQNEWKGLFTCIALDNAILEIKKETLSYQDQGNFFEPPGAIGNMLFEDRDLWCVNNAWNARSQQPFLYTIHYKLNNDLILVGGTAPESILFTSPNYTISGTSASYLDINGKFTDPISNPFIHLDEVKTQILYIYLHHFILKLDEYQRQFAYFNADNVLINQIEIAFFNVFLNNWLRQIGIYANQMGFVLSDHAFPANIKIFQPPYEILFNNANLLVWKSHTISKLDEHMRETLQSPANLPYVQIRDIIVFNPADLLLSEYDNTVIRFEGIQNPNQLNVHLFQCDGQYFSLPLATTGLEIFQDHLPDLFGLNRNAAINSRLTGSFDHVNNTLTVTLTLDIGGKMVSMQRTYRNIRTVSGKHLIIWPDFVSQLWNKYYLYSELPNHEDAELRAIPLQAGSNNFRLVMQENGQLSHTAEKIVYHNYTTSRFEYEIYTSDKPFRGVQFQIRVNTNTINNAGALLLKNLGQNSLRDFRQIHRNLNTADVGFDFGSNNICVSFKASRQNNPTLVNFSNRRVFLLGEENPNDQRPAQPHEVLFFTREVIAGNYIKSMIALHNELALMEGDSGKRKEVAGGFPCLNFNLEVVDNDQNNFKVELATHDPGNNPVVYLMHSLKWVDNNFNHPERVSLYALIKSIWLMTYAELLTQDVYPAKLLWAYPSSMPTYLVGQYNHLWLETATVNPLDPKLYNFAKVAQSGSNELEPLTESEAVSNFALNMGNMYIDRNTVVMGFDIGGSTSDFFCLALDKNMQRTMIRQTSIRRLAAGKLADATSKTPAIQNLLKSFCDTNQIPVFGINKHLNSRTSGYYFNAIVDKLSNMAGPVNLNLFYTHMNNDACKSMFVVNAYLTGLLTFHAGQIAAKITQDSDYQSVNTFQLGFFGRGGRMFEWLRAINAQNAEKYYVNCFNSGFNDAVNKHTVNLFYPDPATTKTEVSYGLSLFNIIQQVDEQPKNVIGEKGYVFNGQVLNEDFDVQAIDGNLLANPGVSLQIPDKFERLTEFVNIFSTFVNDQFNFNLHPKGEKQQDIHDGMISFIPYIMSLPEWQEAHERLNRNERFEFNASLFILQGMAYFENYLLPRI